jgi:nitrous oxidase accessory protein
MTPRTGGNGGSGAAIGAASTLRRLMTYAVGKLPVWQRLTVGAVAVALLPVMFWPVLPVWRIHMVAPQYREGLEMRIHVNDVKGDLRNINILNHYIGMKEISAENFPEFSYLPRTITVFGFVALMAAVANRRWLAFLGWLGFAVFGTVMMLHFIAWLHDYGTNLDPKAALDFGAFTPPLLGTKVRGNFVVSSWPHVGGVILVLAGLLGPVLAAADMWLLRRRQGARSAGQAALVLALLAAGAGAPPARATEFVDYREAPTPSTLQPLVAAAAPGDTLRLPAGVHQGQLVIDRPLVVLGGPDAVLDGQGRGTVVVVAAPGTVLQGFSVRNSGYDLLLDDAAVLLDEADHVLVDGLEIRDANHGVYVRNAAHPVIRGCRLVGRRGTVHEENHGNGIHIWHAVQARIEGNDVSAHRDGIYLSFADSATVTGNLFHGQDRFGLHSMYSQRNVISRNLFTANTAGTALMFSNRMLMEGNLFAHNRGHRTYGLLLRDCSDSRFVHNRLVDNTIGLFLDGSNRNVFTENTISESGWGVIAYSSSEDNEFTRNNFLDNDYQVSLDMRRTHNRLHRDGVGNHWSDARPYDLDGDGLGDAPHQPVGFFAFVSKQFPDLTVFAGSPAVVALDMAQRSLPALQLTELTDPHPLPQPVLVPPYAGPRMPGPAPATGRERVPLAVASLATAGAGFAVLRRRR